MPRYSSRKRNITSSRSLSDRSFPLAELNSEPVCALATGGFHLAPVVELFTVT